MIHPLSDVQSNSIGSNTNIWQFCVVLSRAIIGSNCNICAHVFVENDVRIGNNVTVKSGVQIWDGVTIKDNVFIGPNVTFTNEIIPRSKIYPVAFAKTIIEEGVSIGANSTIIAGIRIGRCAFVGAGSVVTKNVLANTVWYGNPAKQKGFITNEGIILDMSKVSKDGVRYDID